MKILLDHNLDRRLKHLFANHQTSTTHEMGWANVLNGELLNLAEQNGFDVLITADANIKDQQNLTNRNIAILVLRAYNNRLKTHLEMLDEILKALSEIIAAQIVEVFHPELRQKHDR